MVAAAAAASVPEFPRNHLRGNLSGIRGGLAPHASV